MRVPATGFSTTAPVHPVPSKSSSGTSVEGSWWIDAVGAKTCSRSEGVGAAPYVGRPGDAGGDDKANAASNELLLPTDETGDDKRAGAACDFALTPAANAPPLLVRFRVEKNDSVGLDDADEAERGGDGGKIESYAGGGATSDFLTGGEVLVVVVVAEVMGGGGTTDTSTLGGTVFWRSEFVSLTHALARPAC